MLPLRLTLMEPKHGEIYRAFAVPNHIPFAVPNPKMFQYLKKKNSNSFSPKVFKFT